MSKNKCERIETRLLLHYKNRIIVRTGTAISPVYNATKEYNESIDMAVYIHTGNEIAVVWNLRHRRETNNVIKSFSVSQSWDEIKPEEDGINDIYKSMNKSNGDLEKVLVLSVDTLSSIMEDLFSYLQENRTDPHHPDKQEMETDYTDPLQERERHTVSLWNRDSRFRNRVLQRYGGKCAICRCDEKDILEAAHIKAVSKGGEDDATNGLCLCANHHRMLDKEHIRIDYESYKLNYVGDRVKRMAWYQEFREKYKETLLCPNI